MSVTKTTRLLFLECCVAALLLAGVVVWDIWRPLELWRMLQWSGRYGLWGVLAAVPPLLVIPLLESRLGVSSPLLRTLRDDINLRLVPLLRNVRFAETLILSCLAGLSEELFFRGMLQREIGLVLASLVFGLLHALSLAYMLWAAMVGGYFGWLVHWSGNLWLTIIAHTVVDIVGLCYIRYIVARRSGHDA